MLHCMLLLLSLLPLSGDTAELPNFAAGQLETTVETTEAPYGTRTQLVRPSTWAFAPSRLSLRIDIANRNYKDETVRFVEGLNPWNNFRGPNFVTNPELYKSADRIQNPKYDSENALKVAKVILDDFNVEIEKILYPERKVEKSPTIVPTFVPNQQGPFPRTDEIKNAIPTTNVGDVGRGIGIPLREKYLNSPVGVSQRWVGSTVNWVEQLATAPITPELVDFIEMEPIIRTIERADDAFLVPYTYFDSEDPIVKLGRNLTEYILWQRLDYVDANTYLGSVRQTQQDKLAAAAKCALFANALPNCPSSPTTTTTTTTDRFPIILPPTNTSGFLDCVVGNQFDADCGPGGCLAGQNLEADQFNGYYQLVGAKIDSNTPWPVYAKNTEFNSFQSSQILFLTRTLSIGTIGGGIRIDGAWASNTPTTPDYFSVVRGSFPPFGSTLGASPPGNCSNDDPRSFPLCTVGGNWVIGRVSDTCAFPGILIENLCLFQQTQVTFEATACPPGFEVIIPDSTREALVIEFESSFGDPLFPLP
uniref:Uncharacterized protein n=1 Tax=Chromera velia CCMP2878 TaxID=1169474 RepID=A0A0G4FGX8_9ALVE|eukprot:Cvel_16957.t1-p1 / transcript=Cvel_16957.t1 / gene=Cvel_16957 / organism=Chromera_velia_CCMP2878 / gene_product=hypothetical protein / transcript_product=hypothetical protein / location=Cvel_scaffold1330:26540-32123(+) / protein_length=532 / sequence_SO=supercontig / SO=protein_coding / is_pseudo=false